MSDLIKTEKEIQAMRKGGKILAKILEEVAKKVAPGVTTAFLNEEAMRLISAYGARPSFLGYQPKGAPSPYSAALCTSVNDEIVHAIPSKRKLNEGDIIGLDLGIWHKDMCVDAALTAGVGKISAGAEKLIEIARQSLNEGISVVKNGVKIGDIGCAISSYVENQGFSVIRDLAGHGVGRSPHEDPMILNFGAKGKGQAIASGMTLAIEPMIAEGDWHIKTGADGWTLKTLDGKLSAHFEHTVLVTDEGCEILTQISNN